MVFPGVKSPGDHTEGERPVPNCSGIMPSSGTSDNAGYHIVCGRHGGASVTVDGAFESNRSKME